MKDNLFKVDNNTKRLILESSALSGYPQSEVKEVLEYLLITWAIEIADHPDDYAKLQIPFLGEVGVKYKKDFITKEGEMDTECEGYIDFSENFRRLVSDIHSEGYTDITDMLSKKIEQAVITITSKA